MKKWLDSWFKKNMVPLGLSFAILITLSIAVPIMAPGIANICTAHQGCCSTHGGVSADGCGCNDGSALSDTCAPYYTCTATPTLSPTTTPVVVPVVVTPAVVPVTPAPVTTSPAPATTTPTVAGPKIETKDKTEAETIPFTSSTQNDPTMTLGNTVIKIKGENGEKSVVYRVTYKNSVEQSREKVSESITKQPVNELIYKGTKPYTLAASIGFSYISLFPFVIMFVIYSLLRAKLNKKKDAPKNTLWYKKWWGIALIVVFLPYFAVWYVWEKKDLKKSYKVGLIALIIIITLVILGALISNGEVTESSLSITSDAGLVLDEQSEKTSPDNAAEQASQGQQTPTTTSTSATTTTVLTANTQSTSPSQTMPSQCHINGLLPDSSCTPGAADPRVTQDTIKQTICVVGYTTTVRPSTSVTGPEKLLMMAKYGFTDSPSNYEFDHLIPLEGGGSSDLSNLWPEPLVDAKKKDTIENLIHKEICSGQKTLTEAQNEIESNWTLVK